MLRIDLLKIRKTAGLSQRQLAEMLAVRPSFLSAIENGRSRFPEDKIERLLEICGIDDIAPFVTQDDIEASAPVPPHTHPHTHGDDAVITHILEHIHSEAHSRPSSDRQINEKIINILEGQVNRLMDTVNKLYDQMHEQHKEYSKMSEENIRLRWLLRSHGIDPDNAVR